MFGRANLLNMNNSKNTYIQASYKEKTVCKNCKKELARELSRQCEHSMHDIFARSEQLTNCDYSIARAANNRSHAVVNNSCSKNMSTLHFWIELSTSRSRIVSRYIDFCLNVLFQRRHIIVKLKTAPAYINCRRSKIGAI